MQGPELGYRDVMARYLASSPLKAASSAPAGPPTTAASTTPLPHRLKDLHHPIIGDITLT